MLLSEIEEIKRKKPNAIVELVFTHIRNFKGFTHRRLDKMEIELRFHALVHIIKEVCIKTIPFIIPEEKGPGYSSNTL